MQRETAVRRTWTYVVGTAAACVLAGCTATVRSAPPQAGKPSYEISCMDVRDCDRVARRQCGGAYSTLRTWQNTIPDSELPGLNARTQRNTERSTREYDHFDWNPNGPGIESEAPLPITEVIVVCG
jgi:hypothetical protein